MLVCSNCERWWNSNAIQYIISSVLVGQPVTATPMTGPIPGLRVSGLVDDHAHKPLAEDRSRAFIKCTKNSRQDDHDGLAIQVQGESAEIDSVKQ